MAEKLIGEKYEKPLPKYRQFAIMQYLGRPFIDYEADRMTLKPGVVPFITEDQIRDGLDHKTIKRFCWIWHDNDFYTEDDEIADETGNVKAGDLKFKHAHVVIECKPAVTVQQVAKWFGVKEQYVHILHGRGAFMDMVEYLPHETPKALEQNKTHYDYDLIHSNFDFPKALRDMQIARAKYGRNAKNMTEEDLMRMRVLKEGWTMRECMDDNPLVYAKIRSTLPPLRLDYLMRQEPCPFRINIYVDGDGGLGKNSLCEYLAQSLFPDVDRPYFAVGNDSRVVFDGYDGEPVIIWDDWRSADFIAHFSRKGAFNLLDSHPRVQSQQAKNTRVVLTNVVNIINGVEPYMQFLNGLAGEYTDSNDIKHNAEDKNQSYRRFPLIVCVRESDFDVLLNEGFITKDSHFYQQFLMYSHVTGSLSKVMQRLEGRAREKVLVDMTKPVMEAYTKVQDSHEEKISEIEDIPEEFEHYGETMTGKEYAKQLYLEGLEDEFQRKSEEEAEEALERREREDEAYVEAFLERRTQAQEKMKRQDKQDERDTWANMEGKPRISFGDDET